MRRLRLRSTTARFAALAALVLLLASGVVLAVAARLATEAVDAELLQLVHSEADEITLAFRGGGPEAAAALVRAELAEPGRKIILLEGPAGPIAGNAQGWPPTLAVPSRWRELQLFAQGARTPEHFGITAVHLGDGYRLLVGNSLADRSRLLRSFGEALLGTAVAALLLAGAGGWALSRVIAARVRHAVEAAEAVAAGDLSRRVPASGEGDAFDELAQSLNRMLARIDGLVAELRVVTDSLAHDLRSPLTRIRARIERAAVDPDPAAARGALEAVAGEVDLLLRMLTLALEVSRAEAGISSDSFAATDIAALLTDLAEMYEPLAEEAGVAITVDASSAIIGVVHREFLSQAIANLVDNALKHSGGRAIRLSAARTGERIRISVEDDGRGIPAASRERALTRFARLDAARSTPGAGLGLTLVAAVARMHGGTLDLADASHGVRASIDIEAQ